MLLPPGAEGLFALGRINAGEADLVLLELRIQYGQSVAISDLGNAAAEDVGVACDSEEGSQYSKDVFPDLHPTLS
jgi:hypothetical protein